MHGTPVLQAGTTISLEPVNRKHLAKLFEAYEEAPEQALEALPWLEPEGDLMRQLSDLLSDLEHHHEDDKLHFWGIHDKEDQEFCGLIGLGDELQHEYSNYSLGYWVRPSRQRKGIASSSVDTVLSWLNNRNTPIRIELTVHPHNEPGIAACSSICKRWNGKTLPGFIGVEINGRTIPHILHLIDLPRGWKKSQLAYG